MERDKGVFYCVGVGPGDPELLTLKAKRVIERCPVLASPRTGGRRMLALEIVREALDPAGKLVLPLDFAMTRDERARQKEQAAAADSVEHYLAQGLDVAMLNIGDVSIYATCGYLQAILQGRGYACVMIPGVPSFCAVAACLGESLTLRDLPLHIIPAGAFGTNEALDLPGTKVLMKSGRAMRQTAEAILERGNAVSAAMVTDCGLPSQRICRDPARFAGQTGYFSTVVIKAAQEERKED